MSHAYRIVAAQMAAIGAVAAGLCFLELRWGASALLGGLVIVLPNALFAWRTSQLRNPTGIVVASVVKLVLTITLMVIVFVLVAPEARSFFAGLTVSYVVFASAAWAGLSGPSADWAPSTGWGSGGKNDPVGKKGKNKAIDN